MDSAFTPESANFKNTKKILMKEIIKKRFDLIIGATFFIWYKFYFVHLLFRERYVPPEPDDVYSYFFYSKKLFEISSFEQFRSLFFSLDNKMKSTRNRRA